MAVFGQDGGPYRMRHFSSGQGGGRQGTIEDGRGRWGTTGDCRELLKHTSGTTVVSLVLCFFPFHQTLSHTWAPGTIEDTSLRFSHFSFSCSCYCYCSLDLLVSLPNSRQSGLFALPFEIN